MAYFALGGTLKEETPENCRKAEAALATVRERVSPIEVGLFAGVVDLEKYPFFVRLMVKLMKAETGNFRDWQKIEGRAKELASSLASKAAEGKQNSNCLAERILLFPRT